MPPFLDTGLDFIMEGRVGVTYEDHAAGAVGNAVIWVCGGVVEYLGNVHQGAFSGISLLISYGAESDDQIVVNGP